MSSRILVSFHQTIGVVWRIRAPNYTPGAILRRRTHRKRTNKSGNYWYLDKDGRVTRLESLAYRDAFFLFLRFRNLEGEQPIGIVVIGFRKLVIAGWIAPNHGFRVAFGDQGYDLITNRREVPEDLGVNFPSSYIPNILHTFFPLRWRTPKRGRCIGQSGGLAFRFLLLGNWLILPSYRDVSNKNWIMN